MTTILIKKKDTAGAPAPGDLTNSSGGTELAVNTATKRIYTKDAGGNVVELGTNATSSTIADLTVTNSLTVSGTVTSSLKFTDNTYDIGASGATRPRSLFLGTNLTVGGRGAVGTVDPNTSFMVNKNLTGSTSSVQIGSFGVVQSDVTASAFGVYSYLQTAAASFTLPSYFHHAAIQGTIGAGSAVTNQYGYWVDGNMTGATNNYGFYGNIASGTGRYNLYMGGTAANYLEGATTLNSTLTVNSSTTLNSNVQMYNGYLNISSGGSDLGTQLSLWSESSGACYMAGYSLYFNTGSNNARTTKMLLTNAGRLTVGQGVDAGFMLGVAGNVGVFDSSSNVSIGLQNTGSGGHGFRWLAGKTGDTFPGGFGFYDDTSLIYRMGVNSSGDVVFGSSSYSQLQNPSVALYPATGQAAIQAPTGTVAGLRLSGSSGSVAANMGGIIDFFAPYRTSDYDQYYTGRIFAYRENATNNAGGSYMGMQTSTAGFTSTYFLYADSSQRVSLNNKNLQTSYGLTSGRIFVDATGTDVTPTTGAAGLISVQGNGYASYWTMDANGLYIGTNSNSRNIYIGTKGSTNNNPASLTIDSAAENNTINANYYGVSIKSGARQSAGYGIYCDVGLALWGLVGALTTGGTDDWNHISNAHSGQGYTLLLGTASNGPGGGAYYHVWNFEYSAKDGTGNMTQWAIPYSAGSSNQNVFRTRYNGTWSSWYNF